MAAEFCKECGAEVEVGDLCRFCGALAEGFKNCETKKLQIFTPYHRQDRRPVMPCNDIDCTKALDITDIATRMR